MSDLFKKKQRQIVRSITVDPDVEEFLQYLSSKGVKISPLVVKYFRSTDEFKQFMKKEKNL